MEAHHKYRIKAFAAGGRNGVVHAEGVLSCISFSAPPEFLGEPGRWTPEHFLVAAVASCFVSTFSSMAEKSQLDQSYSFSDTGSDSFFGEVLFKRAIHSLPAAGIPTLPSRTISFALRLRP